MILLLVLLIVSNTHALLLNKLHSLPFIAAEAELLLDTSNLALLPENIESTEFYQSILKQRERNSMKDVEDSLKTIQRLILQLDRSDGRKDITSEEIAAKYYSFISTCIRCKGTAWTEVLSPLAYIGFKLDNYIENVDVEGERIRRIQVSKLSNDMCRYLLNFDFSDREQSVSEAKRIQTKQSTEVLNLAMVLVRVMVRYAVYKERLESHEVKAEIISYFTILELYTLLDETSVKNSPIVSPNNIFEEVIMPSNSRLHMLLQFDLQINEEDMPIKGSKRILVRTEHMQQWLAENDVF